jgi:hypothetical protein
MVSDSDRIAVRGITMPVPLVVSDGTALRCVAMDRSATREWRYRMGNLRAQAGGRTCSFGVDLLSFFFFSVDVYTQCRLPSRRL